MAMRIASIVLSFSGLIALILGLLFWGHKATHLIPLHMLLGFLVMGALWVVGIGQAFFRGGSWSVAACALIVGILLAVLGITQTSLMVGEYHWVVQIVHLALGLSAIAIGHIAAARYRKTAAD
jgi:hypothetical protein